MKMKRELRAILAPDSARFLAAALVAASVITVLAAAAGLARVLPVLLDPEVPRRAARPFLVGLIALSVEVGALVGWPLGWVEVALRSIERGEARARMSLGEAPVQRIARLWPALLILSVMTAIGSLAWGRDARAPGRVARALVEEARRACIDAKEVRVVAVPLVRASWLCRPGQPPLLAGEGAGSASAIDFVARSFEVTDDLTAVHLEGAQVLFPTETPTRLRVGKVHVIHLVPFSAPSSVPPWLRATVIVLSALISAMLAVIAVLREKLHRVVGWAIAVAGPAATLSTLRAWERSGVGDARLFVVPLAAAAAIVAAVALVRAIAHLIARRRARYAAAT
jgi:hypothetical protein